MHSSKTKMGKRELILEAVHSMWTAYAILHFYLWTAFKVLVVRKKRHESNKSVEIVHTHCNLALSITETLTMLAPMLGLD